MNRLVDYCLHITDGEHGTVANDNSSNYFLLSNKNIINGKIVITDRDRRISKIDFENLKNKTMLEKHDLIISTVGTLGKTAVIEGDINYVFQRSVGIIKTKRNILNPYYLKYQIDTPFFQKRLNFQSNGGLQKGLYIGDLEKLEILCPGIELQNRITDVLKTLDDKIDNTNRITQDLESMAKTLYDYWFLQFDFPNEAGKPYKSSGGKMAYNKELKREIPEGWIAKNIKKHCKITWGQCPDGEKILPLSSKEKDTMLYCSGAGDMRNGLVVDCQALTNASRRKAYKNDILMSVAGSIGAYAICDKEISLGRAAVAISPKKHETLFTLETVERFLSRMKQVSSGSIQKVVNDSHLDDMNFSYSEVIVNKFSEKYESILERQINLCKENQELTSLRDFLLPLLMNGQAKIGE